MRTHSWESPLPPPSLTKPQRAQATSNNQYITTYPADANGDVRNIITGALKERLTNVGTGKSIIVNVSGPATEIVHFSDDGILTLVSTTDKKPFDVCAALSYPSQQLGLAPRAPPGPGPVQAEESA